MSFLSNLFKNLFKKKEQSQPATPVIQPTVAVTIPVNQAPTNTPEPEPVIHPAQPIKTPPLATIYPATHNFNDWRDVKEGESPEAYFARTGLAGYGRTGEQLMALDTERVRKTPWGQYAATAVATGPFDPNSLSDDDLYYINWHSAEMTFDPRQLMHGLFYGPDVARVGGQKFSDGSARWDWKANESKVRPDVVQAIREMAQGEVKPWMANAFAELGDDRPEIGWKAQHLKSWHDGWKRLHPGMEP